MSDGTSGVPQWTEVLAPAMLELDAVGHAKRGDLVDKIETALNLPPQVMAQTFAQSGERIVERRCKSALRALRDWGFAATQGGIYSITPLGRLQAAAVRAGGPVTWARQAPPTQADGGPVPGGNDGPPSAPPDDVIEVAASMLKKQLRDDLLARVRSIDPTAFEQLIVDLLVKIGFGGSRADAARRLGKSGDGGIDGIIRQDALGLDAVYIQAKRYADGSSVSPSEVQSFAGALLQNGATKGVFVTTSHFTPAAKSSAASVKTQRIVLIDGEELARLMVEHEVGVRTVQVIKIQRVDLEGYEDDEV